MDFCDLIIWFKVRILSTSLNNIYIVCSSPCTTDRVQINIFIFICVLSFEWTTELVINYLNKYLDILHLNALLCILVSNICIWIVLLINTLYSWCKSSTHISSLFFLGGGTKIHVLIYIYIYKYLINMEGICLYTLN